jgi:hypothetical protein
MAAMAGTTRTAGADPTAGSSFGAAGLRGTERPSSMQVWAAQRCAATTCAWCSGGQRDARSRRGVGSMASTFRPRSS